MRRLKPPNRYIAILLIALFLFFTLNDVAYAGRTQVTVSIAFGTVIAGAIGLTIYLSTTRGSLVEGIMDNTPFSVQNRALLNFENKRFILQIPSINIEADDPYSLDNDIDKTPYTYSTPILEIRF